MKRVKALFINMLVLTVTSLIVRTVGISYNVYLSNKIGSAGIGLYHLILSVYFLAVTFGASGIRLTTTRLVAEELAIGCQYGAKKAVRSCVYYGLLVGFSSAAALFFSAGFIGRTLLCDERTVLPLQILALSLPCISITSVFSGYFIAVRHSVKTAFSQILEQGVKIAVTVLLLLARTSADLAYACICISVGNCAGEIFSLVLLTLLCRMDIRRYKQKKTMPRPMVRRMLSIVLPVALSAYVTSAMRTVQQLLIPFGLKKNGESGETALSVYGTIQGMVLPVLLYPCVLLEAVADLIVPELAECQAAQNKLRASYIVTRVFHLGMLMSVCVMCLFFGYSNELAHTIYKSGNTAYFFKILAPVIPVLYLDLLVDSMLKGIGEQLHSMRYNILESTISVVMLYVLLPRFGIGGYIFTIFCTRSLNFWLSVNRLIQIAEVKISILCIVKALFCMAGSMQISGFLFRLFGNPVLPVQILFSVLIYYFLLRALSCITKEDTLWLRGILRN